MNKSFSTHARLAVLLFAVLGLSITVSACGGSGGSDTATAEATSGGGGLKFIYVSTDPATDPTGAIVSNGMKAAGSELGVDAEYRSTKTLTASPTEFKRLLENAIAADPDGLIVSDTEPKALNATIKSATDQGIPVVLSSTGAGEAEAVGALTYVGNDETASGQVGGELLGEEGASHALLVTIPPGIPIVDQRDSGFEEGFPGDTTKLAIKEFDDITGTTNTILATLQKDTSIDAVFTIGSALSPAELAAEKQLGDRAGEIKWATIDTGAQVLEAIDNGTFSFALDQQPYLQGYLPVMYLKQYLELGLRPIESQVPTGPEIVNKENAAQLLSLSEEKLR